MSKIFSGFVAASMVVMMLGAAVVPAPASAATVEELQALIASLTAQIAALSGQVNSTPGASVTFTSNLTVGSRGAEVTALQDFLIAKGYLVMPAGVAKGYFGALTKSAVAAYQAAKGIAPAAGYFGPMTRAAVNAEGSTTTPNTPSTPTDLEGTDGSIADVNELSQYASEEVGEGQDDVKVLGFEVEASNDGDIKLRSIKVSLDATGDGSDNLDDYITGVTVWMGDKEVGSADVDDFSEDSNDLFTKTITLDSGVVVKAEDTEKFYVSVDAAGSLDSSDIDQSSEWNIDVENIRFEDGSGVVTTETGFDLDGMNVPVNFVSFSTAADTELKVSTASDNPVAGVVIIDESDTTDDVVLLKGKIKLEGDSDVNLDELPITLTVTGATDVDEVSGSVTLKLGSEEYTETVTTSSVTSATVTFDNLDFDIEAGDTVEFTVMADIEGTDGGVDEGDTITASLTSTNNDYIDAENEEGDQLADDTEKTGTATGKAQELRTEGIQVALVSTDAVSNNNDAADTGTFTIKYKVTSVGETIYVASLATNSVTYAVYDPAGTATTAGSISAVLQNNTDTSKTSVGNYEIEDGESETFTLTITMPNGAGDASAQYYAALTGVKWDTSDDVSPANTYSSNLDDFQTDPVYLDNA